MCKLDLTTMKKFTVKLIRLAITWTWLRQQKLMLTLTPNSNKMRKNQRINQRRATLHNPLWRRSVWLLTKPMSSTNSFSKLKINLNWRRIKRELSSSWWSLGQISRLFLTCKLSYRLKSWTERERPTHQWHPMREAKWLRSVREPQPTALRK